MINTNLVNWVSPGFAFIVFLLFVIIFMPSHGKEVAKYFKIQIINTNSFIRKLLTFTVTLTFILFIYHTVKNKTIIESLSKLTTTLFNVKDNSILDLALKATATGLGIALGNALVNEVKYRNSVKELRNLVFLMLDNKIELLKALKKQVLSDNNEGKAEEFLEQPVIIRNLVNKISEDEIYNVIRQEQKILKLEKRKAILGFYSVFSLGIRNMELYCITLEKDRLKVE